MHKDKGQERSQQVINKEWQVCHTDGRGVVEEGKGEMQLVDEKTGLRTQALMPCCRAGILF